MSQHNENDATFARISGITEDHRRFESLAGAFDAEVRFFMGPGEPVVSTGTMVNQLILDGRFLRQEFQGDLPTGVDPRMQPFSGQGFLGYNSVDKRYESAWIDNASTLIQVESGQVDAAGREWNFYSSMTNPQSGGAMEKRSILTLRDENNHSMEIWFREPDGPEIRTMEIRYSRRST